MFKFEKRKNCTSNPSKVQRLHDGLTKQLPKTTYLTVELLNSSTSKSEMSHLM
jgi:hypothetical protein